MNTGTFVNLAPHRIPALAETVRYLDRGLVEWAVSPVRKDWGCLRVLGTVQHGPRRGQYIEVLGFGPRPEDAEAEVDEELCSIVGIERACEVEQ